MECQVEAPMLVVDSAVYELRRISNLCHILTQVQCGNDTVDMESVSDMMGILRDCLDRQIKALDGIRWARQTVR